MRPPPACGAPCAVRPPLLLTRLPRLPRSIEELSGLKCLQQLEYLNASSNRIGRVDEGELPPSLLHLNLSNNPAAWEDDYRQRIIGALPLLQDLDAVDVTKAELLAYGFEVSEDEEEGDDVAAQPTPGEGAGGGGGGGEAATADAQQPLQFADDADEGGEGGEGAGSTDFASRYAHDALDVPATLDLMTDGIMDTFRVRREALAAASRQRQQDLKAEGGESAAAEPTEPPGDAGGGAE